MEEVDSLFRIKPHQMIFKPSWIVALICLFKILCCNESVCQFDAMKLIRYSLPFNQQSQCSLRASGCLKWGKRLKDAPDKQCDNGSLFAALLELLHHLSFIHTQVKRIILLTVLLHFNGKRKKNILMAVWQGYTFLAHLCNTNSMSATVIMIYCEERFNPRVMF